MDLTRHGKRERQGQSHRTAGARSKAESVAGTLRFAGNLKCSGGRKVQNASQVGPLIAMWVKIVREEDGASLAATRALQRKRY